EVILDVGIVDTRRGTQESCRLEMVGGAKAALEQKPLRPDQSLGERVENTVQRDGLGGFLLDVKLQMVLQVLPDAGTIRHDRDALAAKLLSRADTGQHEELRRIDRGG